MRLSVAWDGVLWDVCIWAWIGYGREELVFRAQSPRLSISPPSIVYSFVRLSVAWDGVLWDVRKFLQVLCNLRVI